MSARQIKASIEKCDDAIKALNRLVKRQQAAKKELTKVLKTLSKPKKATKTAAKKTTRKTAVKKTTGKTAAKKTTRKTAAKKTTGKTAAKKTTRKTAAKKTTGKTTAKKTTRKAAAKKTTRKTAARKKAAVKTASGLRSGSTMNDIYEAIKKNRGPMHISDIIKSLRKPDTAKQRRSIVASLTTYVRKGTVFTRTAPNTFGVRK